MSFAKISNDHEIRVSRGKSKTQNVRMEVYNSTMTNETLKSDANGIQGGWNRFRRGITSALIRRKGSGSAREHNSRKNMIPKQLVIRWSTNNRFVSRRERTQLWHLCMRVCLYVPIYLVVTSIQFPEDIITRCIIPNQRIFPPTTKIDPARSGTEIKK